jgi:glycosyltransferase involved in cell wall biosynthesis
VSTVLHVLTFFPRGGSAQVVRYLARALDEGSSGWRARVVSGSLGAPGEPGHAPSFFAGLDLRTVPYDAALEAADPLRSSPPLHPSYEDRPGAPDRVAASVDDATVEHQVREWERILAAPGVLDGVAVAHMHHLTPAHEALARVAPALPVVVHLHGTETLMLDATVRGEASWPHAAAWTRRMRAWVARAARVLASSPASAAGAVRLLGVDPRRLEVVPNGVDPRVFDGARATAAERAARWRRWLVEDPRGWSPAAPRPGGVGYEADAIRPLLDPAATVVLFVGRFTAVKRAPLLVRAHARARDRLERPLPLVLWGGATGEWEGEHPADTARRSPWAAEVFLAGWRGHDELPAALGAGDLLAVPSVAERFGQVYLEAMAMGIPPVACDAEGPPSFIDADPGSPARCGWLVAPDDEEDLAAALVAAATDPAERALRGRNGSRLVAERFTWAQIADRVAALYGEVASG